MKTEGCPVRCDEKQVRVGLLLVEARDGPEEGVHMQLGGLDVMGHFRRVDQGSHPD